MPQDYAGQTTYRYTKDYFQYRKIGPVKVKGKGEALVIYELLSSREKMGRQAWRSNRMIHSAMVGRQSELDKLSLHLLKLVNGEGSIVNVMGEAGIGKSRLMAELREKDLSRGKGDIGR